MIQFFWNDKLISEHETKKDAFKQALTFMKANHKKLGFWSTFSYSFLDKTNQESVLISCDEFDDWVWDNHKQSS